MKKKYICTLTLLLLFLLGSIVLVGCVSGSNSIESAYVTLPSELPEGVESIEVIPYATVADKDGNERIYVERNKSYVLRVVLSEGYEPGDMRVNVCGTPRELTLYRIEKNVIYQVNNLIAPAAIDIDVGFAGKPSKVSSDIKLAYESSQTAIPAEAYSAYEVEFDAALFGIEATDDTFTLGEFRELFRSTTEEEVARGEFGKIYTAPSVEWGEEVTFSVRSVPEYKYVFLNGGVMSVANDRDEPYPYGFDKSNINAVTVSDSGSVVYTIGVRSYRGVYSFKESNFAVTPGEEESLSFNIRGTEYTDVSEANDGYFAYSTPSGPALSPSDAGSADSKLIVDCLRAGENDIYGAIYDSLRFYVNGEEIAAERDGESYVLSLDRPYKYGENPYENFSSYRIVIKTVYEGEEYDFYAALVAAGLAEKSWVSLNANGYGNYSVEYCEGVVAFVTDENVYVESGKPIRLKITVPEGQNVRDITELVFNGTRHVASGGADTHPIYLTPEVNENYFTLTVVEGHGFDIKTISGTARIIG